MSGLAPIRSCPLERALHFAGAPARAENATRAEDLAWLSENDSCDPERCFYMTPNGRSYQRMPTGWRDRVDGTFMVLMMTPEAIERRRMRVVADHRPDAIRLVNAFPGRVRSSDL